MAAHSREAERSPRPQVLLHRRGASAAQDQFIHALSALANEAIAVGNVLEQVGGGNKGAQQVRCMQRCASCCEGPRCRCAERAAIRRQRKKRVAHLGAKALGRFKNLLLAKCFQPWSGMARREILEKHVRRPPLFGQKVRLRDACHVVRDVREKLRDALIYQANG